MEGTTLVVLGGVRHNDVSAEVEVTGPLGNTADAETDESWVDPYLGAQYTLPLSDAWSLTYMQMDCESGSGSGRFEYDMAISEPALGIAFTS